MQIPHATQSRINKSVVNPKNYGRFNSIKGIYGGFMGGFWWAHMCPYTGFTNENVRLVGNRNFVSDSSNVSRRRLRTVISRSSMKFILIEWLIQGVVLKIFKWLFSTRSLSLKLLLRSVDNMILSTVKTAYKNLKLFKWSV